MSVKFKLNVKKRTKTTNYIIMWFKLAGMEINQRLHLQLKPVDTDSKEAVKAVRINGSRCAY